VNRCLTLVPSYAIVLRGEKVSDTSCVVRYEFVLRGDESDTSVLAFGPSF
jgi:hypothetical protein